MKRKSSKTKAEKLALGVSLAGGSAWALLEKMSHVVGHAATHWSRNYHCYQVLG